MERDLEIINQIDKFLFWLMEVSDFGYCGNNRWGDLDNNEFTIEELYKKFLEDDNT